VTTEQWQRIKAIVFEASAIDPTLRAAFVARSCVGEEERREVTSLLESMAQAGSSFEAPPVDWRNPGPALQSVFGLGGLEPEPGDLIGRRIGPYEIRREVGRGGMGAVYLASRADREFTQDVALKIIKRGLDTDAIVRRFRTERQILAGLNHPWIARLVDGGTTPDGLPYLVMEYVEGRPITDYCEEHRLTIVERLALFQKVCSAVTYAHQRLVVHRDIKPSNVLVSSTGEPKLLDFGLAKILEADSGDSQTVAGWMTPGFASPEQVRGERVTTISDVYGLGVLLYELLSGRRPFDHAPADRSELLRQIRDREPERPSAIVGQALRRTLRGDLDNIVLKAIDNEPARRYPGARALSEDISRYLARLPVSARRDTVTYRAAKFVRRHRAAVLSMTLIGLTLVAATGVTAHEARVAKEQRLRAERRFADVRRLANSFLFEFHDAIADLPGSLRARQLVVRRATEYLDGLAREAQDDAALERELATANERLATILGGGGVSNLGDLPDAKARYLKALAIREKLATRANASPEDRDALAELRVQLARLFALTGDLDRAEQEAFSAVKSLQQARSQASSLGRLATAFHQLGYVQSLRAKTTAAAGSLAQAVDYARQQALARPAETADLVRLARIEIDGARPLADAGRGAEALAMLNDARSTLERLRALEPHNTRYGENLIEALVTQASVLGTLGDAQGRLRTCAQAVPIAESLRAASPDDHAIQIAVMISHHDLGVALLEAGDTAAGVVRLRTANAEAEAMIREAPDNAFVLRRLAAIKARLGEALLSMNPQDPDGCRMLGDGLAGWDRLVARGASPEESIRYRSLWARCR
jgi:serine/threonine protein kinase